MQRIHYAAFSEGDDVCAAVRDARATGLEVLDVFGPYPVHGIDEAMGLRPSRLTWACFLFGVTGLTLALVLQYWTSKTNWPLDVGGKPFDSLPAFIPVAFELTVLLAGLGTVATFLVWARLFPGRRTTAPDTRVTDDRFVIAARTARPGIRPDDIDEVWKRHGAERSWEEVRP